MLHSTLRALSLSVLLLLMPSLSVAAETQVVHIVTGTEELEPLEKLAAAELTTLVKTLFEVDVKTEPTLSDDQAPYILLGTATNKSLFDAGANAHVGDLGAEGHVIKSLDGEGNGGLVIAGGSPVATLWAAYEFGYQNGVRYLMQSDVYPETPKELTLSGYDVKLEPNLKKRSFQLLGQFPNGFVAWSSADCEALISQLAKLKFNHINLDVHAWHPFLQYEVDGVSKQNGLLVDGDRFHIDPNHPGSTAFGNVEKFDNPDMPEMSTYEERLAAGQHYLRNLIEVAHERGMTVGITLDPLEATPEFKEVLEGSFVNSGPPEPPYPNNHLLSNDGYPYYKSGYENLARAQLMACLDTYPELDELTIRLQESFSNPNEAARALKELQAHTDDLNDIPLEEISKPVVTRVREDQSKLPGDTLLALAFYNRLFRSGELAERELPRLMFAGIKPQWHPYIADLLPGKNSGMVVPAYPYGEEAQPESISAQKVPAVLECALHQYNLSVIAVSATDWVSKEVEQLQKQGWEGISIDLWTPAEHDPSLHFLSRVAFDKAVTPQEAHDDYFATITRYQSSTDRMLLALEHMEQGARLLEESDRLFVSPLNGGGLLMTRYQSDWELPQNWEEIKEHFTQSMIELYRSHDQVKTAGRKELYYYAKRSEAVMSYLTCVEELHAAAEAEADEDLETASDHLYTALESLYDTIDTLNDVARNPSDLGTIVLLNHYAYAPLLEEVERVDAELAEAE